MSDAKPTHLKTLEEIERMCVPGLVEDLHTEGVRAVFIPGLVSHLVLTRNPC